jgi:hypothetical protein
VIVLTRSFIKLYGPPIGKGLIALEKIAIEMSEKMAMRFFSVSTPTYSDLRGGLVSADEDHESSVMEVPWFPEGLSSAEKVKLISRSSQVLGDYDFFFEWGVEPTVEQTHELIQKIDEALTDCKCMYTITTK